MTRDKAGGGAAPSKIPKCLLLRHLSRRVSPASEALGDPQAGHSSLALQWPAREHRPLYTISVTVTNKLLLILLLFLPLLQIRCY